MLPLSDGLPARRFPVVNVSLIVANFAVWRPVAGLVGVRNVSDDIDIAYVADPVDIDLHVPRCCPDRHPCG